MCTLTLKITGQLKLTYKGSETLDITYEGLGEMYEGDSSDMCGEKFPLTFWGAERWISRAQTRKRGPPSAQAEFSLFTFQQVLIVIPFNKISPSSQSICHIFSPLLDWQTV